MNISTKQKETHRHREQTHRQREQTHRQRKTNICNHLHVVSKKKNYTDGLIYKTEKDSQTQKTNLW